MTSIPRKSFASEKSVLYKSLGLLIKDYRQWRSLSQETLAEIIGISVRQLQNWEADRHSARIENLHDLSEMTGIPMQICVALNAGHPVWYSLQNRRFAYSSIDETLFSSRELLRKLKRSDDGVMTKYIPITTDKHISMILSCHCDIYGTKRSLGKDIIKAACLILPDLNFIAFDCWGHYVGHEICLPITSDAYEQLKKQKTFEGNLTYKSICDIVSLETGVVYIYSMYTANTSVAQSALVKNHRYFANINSKDNYLVVHAAATKEAKKLSDNFGMKPVFNINSKQDDNNKETVPALYEIGLDTLEKRALKLFPLVEKQPQKLKKPVTKVKVLPSASALKHKNLQALPEKTVKYDNSLVVGSSLSVGKKKVQAGSKAQQAEYDLKKMSCPNPNCPLYGKVEESKVIANGTYRTKEGAISQRFFCNECGKSFCSRAGSLFYGLRTPEEKILTGLKLLAKGMPPLSVSKVLGVRHDTVQRWLEVAIAQKGKIDAMLIKDSKVSK
ncbi:MAG: helix-turn-helix domain-containing protein [Proteobacteria bacterium]|nr:helix-turn-helix domain-containing protein [Pseudomonadota bacterium]